MALRIAAVGEIVEECFLNDSGGETRGLGGISANFARSAHASGAEVTLFSAVGTDATGERLRAAWKLPGSLRVMPGESAEQKIRIDSGGERRFVGFRPGVLTDYRLEAGELAQVNGCHLAHVPVQPETKHLLEGITTRLVADFSIDSAAGHDARDWIEPYLPRLSIAFIGGEVAHLAALQSLRTDTVIVLTCGAAGAYAISGGQAVHQKTLATTIVDTTGCGDAFAGAFTVAHDSGASFGDALRRGAERAAVVAAHLGSGTPVP